MKKYKLWVYFILVSPLFLVVVILNLIAEYFGKDAK
jgi:hypothetical protein